MSSPTLPLSGKVILVTGGARRVGAAIVRRAHTLGARIALHYRQSALEADVVSDELNHQRPDSVFCLQADLNQHAEIAGLVQKVINRFGRLDALINNASTFYPTPLEKVTEADWDALVGSNFMAPLFLSQSAAPHLCRSRGTIVNITDIHAERPLKGYPLYCAAKGALLTLTRALAIELAPEVRVNAVAPGPILWPEDATFDHTSRDAIVNHTLLKRSGSPEDIAAAVCFLLNDAPYITGQVINVDGGRTAHL